MSCATADKYVVFLSFRGRDTRANFISFLHRELDRRGIRAFKDDEELENGQRISPELNRAIEESRFAVVVVSVNYAESSWCLNELVKIMDLEKEGKITVMPIFYGVDPCHVRRQIGVNAEHQFKKHEDRGVSHQKILSWRLALGNLANISGDCSSDWNDDSKLVDKIADKISEKLKISRTISDGKNIDDIDKHMKKLNRLMESYSTTGLRVVGIWARGGIARSALAKYLYQTSSEHFESHCFLENVKLISQGRHFKSHLHEEFLKNIKGECTKSLWDQKVLLVADDVDKLEQLDALAEDYSGFRRGSVVVITTQDKQLLHNHGVKIVYEIDDLRFHQEVDDTFDDFILITVFMLAYAVKGVYRKVRGKEPF